MTIAHLLFSFHGRIGRAKYWLGNLCVSVGAGAILGLYVALVGAIAPAISKSPITKLGTEDAANYAGYWPLLVPIVTILLGAIWSILAIGAKRFHDRNKSAWLLVGAYALSFVAIFVPMLLIVNFIVSLWIFIEFGFFRGTDGPNRFDEGPSEAYLDDAFGEAPPTHGPAGGKASLGGMEAAMAAVNAAARAAPPVAPQSAYRAPTQFGRLGAAPSSGSFGRKV
jgi:uncharacterized membrane protein YhaH (DUF805 family)